MADSSWDNTGLLVDSSTPEGKNQYTILLTVDLTQGVVNEAIRDEVNMIVAYHPFIFKGLKSITPQDPQQHLLLKLIQNNISVYSPHTAIDSASGGVNDFLADELKEQFGEDKREVIIPDAKVPNCGMGRLVTLGKTIDLRTFIQAIKDSVGMSKLLVAAGNNSIRTVAICAGSGGSVFRGVKADAYWTGELSHHEALFFKELGSTVVACNHSNTERLFLREFRRQLQELLPDADIFISEADRDPYDIC